MPPPSKQYQIVFIELDSLFVRYNKISKYTKKIIKELKSQIKIVIVTGKDFAEVKPYLKKIGLNNKKEIVICCGGRKVTKGNGEIIKKIEKFSVTKAVHFVTDLCEVKKENIVVIGRWENNNDLLKIAGLSVAVCGFKNNETKRIADYLTDNREADGVTKALVKIFNLDVKK